VSAVVRSLQAEPIVLAAQPNYTYQLGQAAGAARPPSHGRSGRTRLSLNGSKPLISPEASGVDRVIGSGADAPPPEFLGGIRNSPGVLAAPFWEPLRRTLRPAAAPGPLVSPAPRS
jgi:hypothetical protein